MPGYLGARFPWESALTGAEVCPAVAQDVRDQEVTGRLFPKILILSRSI